MFFSKLLSFLPFFSKYTTNSAIETTPEEFVNKWTLEHHVLVNYYTPWCRRCQDFAPRYEEIAKYFGGSDVNVVKINCETHVRFCDGKGVDGYPMIIFYNEDGTRYDYRGIRDVQSIIDFVEKAKEKVEEMGNTTRNSEKHTTVVKDVIIETKLITSGSSSIVTEIVTEWETVTEVEVVTEIETVYVPEETDVVKTIDRIDL